MMCQIDRLQAYRIGIALVYEEAEWRKLVDQDNEDVFPARMKAVLEACEGIEVADVVSVSEADFTVFRQRRMARWNLDQYSLRSEDADVHLLTDD